MTPVFRVLLLEDQNTQAELFEKLVRRLALRASNGDEVEVELVWTSTGSVEESPFDQRALTAPVHLLRGSGSLRRTRMSFGESWTSTSEELDELFIVPWEPRDHGREARFRPDLVMLDIFIDAPEGSQGELHGAWMACHRLVQLLRGAGFPPQRLMLVTSERQHTFPESHFFEGATFFAKPWGDLKKLKRDAIHRLWRVFQQAPAPMDPVARSFYAEVVEPRRWQGRLRLVGADPGLQEAWRWEEWRAEAEGPGRIEFAPSLPDQRYPGTLYVLDHPDLRAREAAELGEIVLVPAQLFWHAERDPDTREWVRDPYFTPEDVLANALARLAESTDPVDIRGCYALIRLMIGGQLHLDGLNHALGGRHKLGVGKLNKTWQAYVGDEQTPDAWFRRFLKGS